MYPPPGYLPISITANGSFEATLSFADSDGQPVDFTGGNFICQVRPVEGSEAILGVGQVTPSPDVPGEIDLIFSGADFAAAVPGSEEYAAAWDCVFEIDGLRTVLLEGPFSIRPGVSQ